MFHCEMRQGSSERKHTCKYTIKSRTKLSGRMRWQAKKTTTTLMQHHYFTQQDSRCKRAKNPLQSSVDGAKKKRTLFYIWSARIASEGRARS